MHSKSHLDLLALTDATSIDSLSTHTSRGPATTIYVGRKRLRKKTLSAAVRLLLKEQALRAELRRLNNSTEQKK